MATFKRLDPPMEKQKWWQRDWQGKRRRRGGGALTETCPISTEGVTRRVQLVREGGGGGGGGGGGVSPAARPVHPVVNQRVHVARPPPVHRQQPEARVVAENGGHVTPPAHVELVRVRLDCRLCEGGTGQPGAVLFGIKTFLMDGDAAPSY